MAPFKLRAILHHLLNGKLFGEYNQAATGTTVANSCQVTDLFPCDMNIFRPHDFPLVSGNADAASLNHPTLVKTSDQSSFCSYNFLPFTSADISPVQSLN
jgi:hypothetical protein